MGDINIDLGTVEEAGSAADRSITLYNSGPFASYIDIDITSNANWLTALPIVGQDGGGDTTGIDVVASFASAALAIGSYLGTLTVTDPNATNSPFTIDLSLEVIAAAPAVPYMGALLTLSWSHGTQGGNNVETDRSFTLKNHGGGTLSASAALNDNMYDVSYSNYDDVVYHNALGSNGWDSGPATDFFSLSKTTGITDDETITISPVWDWTHGYSGMFITDLTLTSAGATPLKLRLAAELVDGEPDPLAIISTPSQHYIYTISAGGTIPDEVIPVTITGGAPPTTRVGGVLDPAWLGATPLTGIANATDITLDFTGVNLLAPGIHMNEVCLSQQWWMTSTNEAYGITVTVIVT